MGGRCGFGGEIGRLARFLLSKGSRNVCMENLAMAGDMNILDYLEAGIRAEGVRQQTIANNVANMGTPGFRRSDVRFEELLAKAMKAGGDVDKSKLEAEVFQPKNYLQTLLKKPFLGALGRGDLRLDLLEELQVIIKEVGLRKFVMSLG